ncbi:phosphonate metabolism protein/1,5-bisphosphokinase (PRPP-forming) PhnN [Cochlodiniinecator piscidefendens]|uniref:phosphonate metabolism protein/1,5-bisphosphokinase (PRPP-forming) PhnN n=1 Tax=Cochlodiniinecator piscidefendens TaxID=2715756 RepID=UPI00140E8D4B|nr:phosphonate metabolism protein/1,5-bisphosphokinase (PRPP-forming) PhnN [Cochlodiniinecator piscidefendens]
MPRIFAVVGPSGVGKDTLMEAAQAQLPDVHLIRRTITRPENAGGENFTGVCTEKFEELRKANLFALHWQAHGLSYGIPTSTNDLLANGKTVIFNGSRLMLSEAVQVFPELKVIHITANRDVLAARLTARGRENPLEIERRLDRAYLPLPGGLDVIEIDNSGLLEHSVQAVVDALAPVSR